MGAAVSTVRIIEHDGLSQLRRSVCSDRYIVSLLIGTRLVNLYLLPKALPELTNIDLTPNEPHPPAEFDFYEGL